jgi:UDP-glucose 4-epimerase
MAEVLVTGGAGYIGSHTIIELLKNTGYDVVSIDNFSNSDEGSYSRVTEISGKEITSHPLDLCDADSLKKIFSMHDEIIGVIHFAAFKSVPESMEKPLRYYSNNVDSLINLLRICKDYKVRNFIFSSSCSVYGNTNALPVKEDTPFAKAESPYGHTKQIGEGIMESFCRANPKFKGISLRYFNPAGAHESGLTGELPIGKPSNLVPAITQFAIGKLQNLTVHGSDYDTRDGSCIRDYVHVSDIASAHVLALEKLIQLKEDFYNVYNLGSGKGVSVLEAIHSFEKVSGKKLNYTMGPRRGGDVVSIYADNSLAKSELNWNPTRGIDDIMGSAWMWEKKLAELAANPIK